MKITIKRIKAGHYKMTDGNRTVTIGAMSKFWKPTNQNRWFARADWNSQIETIPVSTFQEARELGEKMLKGDLSVINYL